MEETKAYYVPPEEQETVVNYGRTEADMTIYSTDRTVITKLDKAVKGGLYEVIELHKVRGKVIGKTYKASKKLLSFRTKEAKKRELTEEQREVARERMNANRKKKDSIEEYTAFPLERTDSEV